MLTPKEQKTSLLDATATRFVPAYGASEITIGEAEDFISDIQLQAADDILALGGIDNAGQELRQQTANVFMATLVAVTARAQGAPAHISDELSREAAGLNAVWSSVQKPATVSAIQSAAYSYIERWWPNSQMQLPEQRLKTILHLGVTPASLPVTTTNPTFDDARRRNYHGVLMNTFHANRALDAEQDARDILDETARLYIGKSAMDTLAGAVPGFVFNGAVVNKLVTSYSSTLLIGRYLAMPPEEARNNEVLFTTAARRSAQTGRELETLMDGGLRLVLAEVMNTRVVAGTRLINTASITSMTDFSKRAFGIDALGGQTAAQSPVAAPTAAPAGKKKQSRKQRKKQAGKPKRPAKKPNGDGGPKDGSEPR